MKIRNGFVSNSSSSSYVCHICGEAHEVEYKNFTNSGLVRCINGHIVCEDHVKKTSKVDIVKQLIDNKEDSELERIIDNLDEYVANYYESYPEELCPICSMKQFNKEDLLKYLLKESELTEVTLINNIRCAFNGDYSKFKKYINKK